MILRDKVGLITGSAQGIGRAYALGVAREGSKVVVADLADGSGTVKDIVSGGGDALLVRVDVGDESSVAAMIETTVEHYGRIDYVVNNAGVYGSLTPQDWDSIPTDEWNTTMRVDVHGQYLVCKNASSIMKAQGGGKIINMSSFLAHVGAEGGVHYGASQAAIIGMSRALARELGKFGINVNVVTSGLTMTDASLGIIERSGMSSVVDKIVDAQCLKRPQQSEDLVGSIVFLASKYSDFITGQVLNVDGGLVLY